MLRRIENSNGISKRNGKDIKIYIIQTTFRSTTSVKYLGIHFDNISVSIMQKIS